MSAKSERKKKQASDRSKRKAGQLNPGANSRYARKIQWCRANECTPWDFLGIFPKPWN